MALEQVWDSAGPADTGINININTLHGVSSMIIFTNNDFNNESFGGQPHTVYSNGSI